MAWFGLSKDEVWRQLSQEIGAEFIEGHLLNGSKVQAHVDPWTVTLDLGFSQDEDETRTTRIRAPYVNSEGFRFTIYRKSVFTNLGKPLGMQDIEVGDPQLKALFDLFAAVLDRLCKIGSAYKQDAGVEL